MIMKNYGMLILLLRLFMMFKKNVNHGFIQHTGIQVISECY